MNEGEIFRQKLRQVSSEDPTVPFINLSKTSQLQICPPALLKWRLFKYFSFARRHHVKLCQQRALEIYCRTEMFSFLVPVLNLPASPPPQHGHQQYPTARQHPAASKHPPESPSGDVNTNDSGEKLLVNSFPWQPSEQISSQFHQCSTKATSLDLTRPGSQTSCGCPSSALGLPAALICFPILLKVLFAAYWPIPCYSSPHYS